MGSYRLLCLAEFDDDYYGDPHETIMVVRKCTGCGELVIVGYMCDTCGREHIDPVGQEGGHRCPERPPA